MTDEQHQAEADAIARAAHRTTRAPMGLADAAALAREKADRSVDPADHALASALEAAVRAESDRLDKQLGAFARFTTDD
jgi:hypothetical protein